MATEFISTCNKTGEDYADISDWEAALGTVDLTSAATKVFSHGGITGTISDGASVTGQTSGATGTVIHATSTQILIQSISGTFQSSEQIYVTENTHYVDSSDAGDSAIAVLELYDDDGQLNETGVTISGMTTSATNKLIIRVPDSERAKGVYTDGASGNGFLWAPTNSTAIEPTQGIHIDVIGLQVKGNGSGQRAFMYQTDETRVINVMLRDWQTDRAAFNSFQQDSLYINCVAWNISGTSGTAYEADGGSGALQAYHCGAYNSGNYGFEGNTSAQVLKNCWSFVHTTDAYDSTTGTFTTNASSTTTGSAGLTSLTATDQLTNLTAGSEDFHIKDTNADIYNAGTNLSDTPSGTGTDIDGDTRSRYDVGIDEFVGGAPAAVANPLFVGGGI